VVAAARKRIVERGTDMRRVCLASAADTLAEGTAAPCCCWAHVGELSLLLLQDSVQPSYASPSCPLTLSPQCASQSNHRHERRPRPQGGPDRRCHGRPRRQRRRARGRCDGATGRRLYVHRGRHHRGPYPLHQLAQTRRVLALTRTGTVV